MISVLLIHLFTLSPLYAQTLTGSAPSHVAVGEQFRLTYTVNTQNASDFRAGDIPDELEVLIGPIHRKGLAEHQRLPSIC